MALYSQTEAAGGYSISHSDERLRPGQHLHHIGVVIAHARLPTFDFKEPIV